MKTAPWIHSPVGVSARPLLSCAAFLVLLPLARPAAPDAAKTEPKTHVLFMGSDFDVQYNKSYYRVRDVSGGSFVINVKGEPVKVAIGRETVGFKIAQSLKLTEDSASVANLKSEAAYTPANDPRVKWAATGTFNDMSAATRTLVATQVASNQRSIAVATHPNVPSAAFGPAPDVGGATESFNNASLQGGSDMINPGYNTGKMEEELAKKLFDAIEVVFEVSSEKTLSTPYVVVVAQYHERDTPPAAVRNWIYAEALEPIGPKPRKVRIKQGGFPAGFELQKCHVHLYDRGQELATNVADMRVELTRDEAFKYVLGDYLSSHKGATLQATPAMGNIPPDLRTRLTADQLSKQLFVKVSKDGLPLGTYSDEACSQEVADAYVQSVVREIRFRPALDNGKAVAGVARLQFSALRM